mmetsp:Transcript_7750/g.24276  ORF Transcript_7750/g.24276 Transcript_7750/m.24276 type:complete len:98 (-) Transcript_7750:816-1109(-)
MAKGCHASAGDKDDKDKASLTCNAHVSSIQSCDKNVAEGNRVEGNPGKSQLQQHHTNQEQLQSTRQAQQKESLGFTFAGTQGRRRAESPKDCTVLRK